MDAAGFAVVFLAAVEDLEVAVLVAADVLAAGVLVAAGFEVPLLAAAVLEAGAVLAAVDRDLDEAAGLEAAVFAAGFVAVERALLVAAGFAAAGFGFNSDEITGFEVDLAAGRGAVLAAVFSVRGVSESASTIFLPSFVVDESV